MELFSIRIQRTFQLVSTILQEKGTQKAPLHIKKYIENAIPYKEPVGGINLAYV